MGLVGVLLLMLLAVSSVQGAAYNQDIFQARVQAFQSSLGETREEDGANKKRVAHALKAKTHRVPCVVAALKAMCTCTTALGFSTKPRLMPTPTTKLCSFSLQSRYAHTRACCWENARDREREGGEVERDTHTHTHTHAHTYAHTYAHAYAHS